MKSRIIVTLLPIVLMFFGSRAQAANYAVKAAGAGTFSTIQACANAGELDVEEVGIHKGKRHDPGRAGSQEATR